jgi:hypothetical protein
MMLYVFYTLPNLMILEMFKCVCGLQNTLLRSVRYVRLSFFLKDIFIDLHNVIKLLACNFQIKYCILISTYLGVIYKIYVSLNSFKEKILLLP